MMSPALLFIWIPVIALTAILLPGTLLLGVAVTCFNGATAVKPWKSAAGDAPAGRRR